MAAFLADILALDRPRLLVLLLGGIIFVKFAYVGLTCPTRRLPGPWYTRFTHLRLKHAVVTGQRVFYIDDLHQRYGPVVRLSPTEVGVADLDAFKEIHKIGTKYMKSDWYLRLANFPKAGVFTMLDPHERTLSSGNKLVGNMY